MKIMNFFFGEPGEGMSQKDREIFHSLRKLKSLHAVEGRVLIDASEVVTTEFINE